MKKTLLFCACFMLVGFSVLAAPSRLEESEVSASNLKSILGERFGTSIDEDGMIIVKKGEFFRANIIIDRENKVLLFFHGWTAKPSADKLKCLEKLNRWNFDRGFNCVVYDQENKVFLWSYNMLYTGGITSINLLDTVELLLGNEEDFVKEFYEAGLLE